MNRYVLKRCCRLSSLSLQSVRSVTQDHYKVLGLKPDASQNDIKLAYKQMSKKLHPDLNRNDPKTHDKFIRLQEAYTVLGNSDKRREYDRDIKTRKRMYEEMFRQEFKNKPYYNTNIRYHYGNKQSHLHYQLYHKTYGFELSKGDTSVQLMACFFIVVFSVEAVYLLYSNYQNRKRIAEQQKELLESVSFRNKDEEI